MSCPEVTNALWDAYTHAAAKRREQIAVTDVRGTTDKPWLFASVVPDTTIYQAGQLPRPLVPTDLPLCARQVAEFINGGLRAYS